MLGKSQSATNESPILRTRTDLDDIELGAVFSTTSPVAGPSSSRQASRLSSTSRGSPSNLSNRLRNRSSIDVSGMTSPGSLLHAEKIYHSLHNKRKVFLFQIVPLIILFVLQLHFRVRACGARERKGDLDGKKGTCVNQTAELTKMVNYCLIIFICYQARKELIEWRCLLLHDVEGVYMGLLGYVLVGTPKKDQTKLTPQKLADMILGKLPRHRPYNVRGNWMLTWLIATFYAAYYANYSINDGFSETGYLICTFCYIFYINFMVYFNVKSVLIPAIVLGIQVGVTSKSRISLWNTSDLALGEYQRFCMHSAIGATFVAVYVMMNSIVFRDYFGITTGFLVLIGTINIAITFSIIFVPILPVIFVLREKKEALIGKVLEVLERYNHDYLTKLEKVGADSNQEKDQLDKVINYLEYVKSATVLPSSLEVIRTSAFSLGMTVIPVVVVSLLLGEQ